MSSGEKLYEVSQLPAVTRQIRELVQKAHGTRLQELLDALRTIYIKLQTEPLDWGDPEYHPRKEGSIVCHGVSAPLLVQYVVFEPERKVTILRIKDLPKRMG